MDYLYIRAWDRMMGSYPSWTKGQLSKARRESAPMLAIYHRDGKWMTVNDIDVVETLKRLAYHAALLTHTN
ncbi:Uncharacterised protein [Mycobacteroides abscessus subsp. massiliense]|nr:Uncharacterised protein [Mycobacteroides abscessus subsp. massiliense]SKZ09058.1 Uncharacterised protein [Mycobacteroides abscessus subsp. massiliense]